MQCASGGIVDGIELKLLQPVDAQILLGKGYVPVILDAEDTQYVCSYKKGRITVFHKGWNPDAADKMSIYGAEHVISLHNIYQILNDIDVEDAYLSRIDLKLWDPKNEWRYYALRTRVKGKHRRTPDEYWGKHKQFDDGYYCGSKKSSSELAAYDSSYHGRCGTDFEFRIRFDKQKRPLLTEFTLSDIERKLSAIELYKYNRLPPEIKRKAKRATLHNALHGLNQKELNAFIAEYMDVNKTNSLRSQFLNELKAWLAL